MSTCNAMLCPALKLVTGPDDQHQPHRRHDPLVKYTRWKSPISKSKANLQQQALLIIETIGNVRDGNTMRSRGLAHVYLIHATTTARTPVP
jgi:hypothetical protein